MNKKVQVDENDNFDEGLEENINLLMEDKNLNSEKVETYELVMPLKQGTTNSYFSFFNIIILLDN